MTGRYEEQKAKERELVDELAQTRKNLISVIYRLTPDLIEDRITGYSSSDENTLAEAARRCTDSIYQKWISTDQLPKSSIVFF